VTDFLYLKIEGWDKPVLIEIMSEIGQLIYSELTKNKMNVINLSALPKGVYILNLSSGNKNRAETLIKR